MTPDTERTPLSGQRGPSDHAIREQIVSAATEHFSHYGYGKTTVSDLAKAIGISKAYIYKFFDSKQAIGEAICEQSLDKIATAALAAAEGGKTATEKYRRFFKAIVETSAGMFFNDRRLYDIAAYSTREKWPSSVAHNQRTFEMLQDIVRFGRETGEFERKTPLDETTRAILQVMQPLTNPVMLEHNLDLIEETTTEVSNLVLRSLAP
jgi:AcrR family transcriptional regulator